MPETAAFETHVYDTAATAIRKWKNNAAEIYAVSFFVQDEEDDPRSPMLILGYNTEAQVKEKTEEASDEAEARWNYAFWLQNQERVIAGTSDETGKADAKGKKLRKQWLDSLGLTVTDDEFEEFGAKAEKKAGKITREFVGLAVRVAKRLHDEGVVEKTLGRAVPILVHELEYYDAIGKQTKLANPPGVAKAFVDWVKNQ